MYITWNERLAQSPELSKFANWPQLSSDKIPKKKRTGFLVNCRIVAQVLDHKSSEAAGEAVGVSKSKVSKLMTRCLAGDEEDSPALTMGLVPGLHTVPSIRRSAFSTFANTKGAPGSFKMLLRELPELQERLKQILEAHVNQRAHGQNISPKFYFAAFIQFLEEINWPKDKYPFTEERLGYESLRKYMNIELQATAFRKTVKHLDKLIQRPTAKKVTFSTIQLDEHTYDLNCSMSLSLGDNLSALRVSRVTLIISVDVESQAVLSYVVVLNRAANQQDVLDCIAGIYQKWERKTLLTPGLEYGPKDGFPSGYIFDETNAPAIGELQLDNALAHIANRVRSYITVENGATYNLGLPASPKSRNWVEYAFKILTDDAHRFKSTTGSNSQDPKKESRSNQKRPPITSISALEETIEVLLASHNNRRRANLGASSPLEIIEHQLTHCFVPRLTPEQYCAVVSPTYIVDAKVHFRPNDKRAPYIDFHYLRYTGKCINDPQILNQYVEIHINKNDLRKLTVFKNGKLLGDVLAPKSWQRFPHSDRTRSYIFHLINNRSLNNRTDPLVAYFNYLLLHKDLPKQALEVVRVYREFTSGTGSQYVPESASTESFEDDSVEYSELEDFPAWNPNLSGF
jgi:putative transposase